VPIAGFFEICTSTSPPPQAVIIIIIIIIIITFMQGIFNYTLNITHEINYVSTANNVAAIQ
jgi:hypothetical protein